MTDEVYQSRKEKKCRTCKHGWEMHARPGPTPFLGKPSVGLLARAVCQNAAPAHCSRTDPSRQILLYSILADPEAVRQADDVDRSWRQQQLVRALRCVGI